MPDSLDEEIASWKGFPWALRKEDVEIWDSIILEVKKYEEAIKQSEKPMTTDSFLLVVLFVHFKKIVALQREVASLKKFAGM